MSNTNPKMSYRIFEEDIYAFWAIMPNIPSNWISLEDMNAWRNDYTVFSDPTIFVDVQKRYPRAEMLKNIG